jgi:hypothetical protein
VGNHRQRAARRHHGRQGAACAEGLDTAHATNLPEALQLLAKRAPEGTAITLDLHPIGPIPPT